MPYELSNREFSSLKGALTRAVNSGDVTRVCAERDRAFAIFEAKGWPDDWARWDRAADDATLKARYAL